MRVCLLGLIGFRVWPFEVQGLGFGVQSFSALPLGRGYPTSPMSFLITIRSNAEGV